MFAPATRDAFDNVTEKIIIRKKTRQVASGLGQWAVPADVGSPQALQKVPWARRVEVVAVTHANSDANRRSCGAIKSLTLASFCIQ